MLSDRGECQYKTCNRSQFPHVFIIHLSRCRFSHDVRLIYTEIHQRFVRRLLQQVLWYQFSYEKTGRNVILCVKTACESSDIKAVVTPKISQLSIIIRYFVGLVSGGMSKEKSTWVQLFPNHKHRGGRGVAHVVMRNVAAWCNQMWTRDTETSLQFIVVHQWSAVTLQIYCVTLISLLRIHLNHDIKSIGAHFTLCVLHQRRLHLHLKT